MQIQSYQKYKRKLPPSFDDVFLTDIEMSNFKLLTKTFKYPNFY